MDHLCSICGPGTGAFNGYGSMATDYVCNNFYGQLQDRGRLSGIGNNGPPSHQYNPLNISANDYPPPQTSSHRPDPPQTPQQLSLFDRIGDYLHSPRRSQGPASHSAWPGEDGHNHRSYHNRRSRHSANRGSSNNHGYVLDQLVSALSPRAQHFSSHNIYHYHPHDDHHQTWVN